MPEDSQQSDSPIGIRNRLKTNKLGKRLCVAIVVTLFLAAFLHFREVRVDILQVDATAKKYVVAQVDFEFPDEEGTIILQQETLKDVGKIYQINVNEVKDRRFAFEDFLIHNEEWRKKLPMASFEEMYKCADSLQDVMLATHFTDKRTYKRLEQAKMPTEGYFFWEGSPDVENIHLSDEVWKDYAEQLSKMESFQDSSIRYIIDYFKQYEWNLLEDRNIEKELQAKLIQTVPSKYSRIQAGSRIIDEGEGVNKKHQAMLKAMKSALDENRSLWSPLTIASSLIYAILIVVLFILYIRINHKEFLLSFQKTALYGTILILLLILAKGTEYFFINNSSHLIDTVRFPLFVPFAALLVTILIGTEVAFFTTAVLSVIMGYSLAVEHGSFLIINLIAGLVAILCARGMRKRKEVFGVCGKVVLACIPVFFVYNFAQNSFWDISIAYDILSAAVFMFFTAILVVGLLPVFESLFAIMTDFTLMEYMDPNNELLRRLSLEAPGTYQHCLVVGSLSEAAAQAIGANGLFCRVSTLYHDIGKLFNPHYFTENQMGGFNIHQLLTPIESAQVIIAHVIQGEELGRKHGLPQSFLDVITEHHGTTLVYYFYCKQVEQMGGDVDAVDESQFRYPGPTPRTKESAIIMIADTIEAASRSMEDANEEAITELVDRLVSDKAEEGQFDHCQLSFEELGIVKKTIIRTLAVTRHLRVKYPEKKEG